MRLLITRSRNESSELTRLLEQQGMHVHHLKTIEYKSIAPSRYQENVMQGQYNVDALIFTSQHAVGFFFKSLRSFWTLKKIKHWCRGIRAVAAVGSATESALQSYFQQSPLVPEPAQGAQRLLEWILSNWQSKQLPNILWPCAKEVALDIVVPLTTLDFSVVPYPCYETCPIAAQRLDLKSLQKEALDAILFYSPSSVRALHTAAKQLDLLDKLTKVRLLAWGPSTQAQLKNLGYLKAEQLVETGERMVLETLLAGVVK